MYQHRDASGTEKSYYKLAHSDPSHGTRERAENVSVWIQTVEERFDDRILAVDAAVLDVRAKLCGQAEAEGRKLPVLDCLLVATAEQHHLTVVTRNVIDFRNCLEAVRLYDPY
jgi:predicted nucleic acid-binding protein